MNFYRIFSSIYRKAAKRMCFQCKDFIKKRSKILDLGCGSGIVGKEFEKFFNADLLGIDIEDKRVEKIPFRIFDGFKIPFPDNYFDLTLISYVLHHAQDPEALLKEAKRVSKKIIIFEDLPKGLLSKLRCFLHQTSYNLFFQRKKQKFNFKTKEEWEKIFKENGLKIIEGKKVSASNFDFFDPVYRILFVLEKI